MAEENNEEAVDEVSIKPKKSPRYLIIIVGMLILFGAGGFFAWKYFLPISIQEGEKKAKNKHKIGPIYPFETFIVNLADKDSQRYLKLTIHLELDQPKLIQELNQRKPQLRDIIIGLLTMQMYSDVITYKGKAFIRNEIMNRINNVLLTGSIRRVFFTDFVLQ